MDNLKHKILIVDDEKGLVITMKYYFEMEGYIVFTAFDGEEAIKKIMLKPDIILLDINMPKMDGLTVCEKVRDYTACPILFLTARITQEDKIRGLNKGGDDYIIKPFDLDEVNARVSAHLRRERRKQGESQVRIFNEVTIDYKKRQVFVKDEPLGLSKRQFEIVELLSFNGGQIFNKERIYEKLWGFDGEGDSNTVKEHIRKIRSKFVQYTQHEYIETVWGVGYRWNG